MGEDAAPLSQIKVMSQHKDKANEMNRILLDKKRQYDFFINIVRPRKRFSPYAVKKDMKHIELVKRVLWLFNREGI